VGVQEVRWNREGATRAEDYNFFCRNGNWDHQLKTGCFVHYRIVSAAKRLDFIQNAAVKVNSTCKGNYWRSSVWISTQQVNY